MALIFQKHYKKGKRGFFFTARAQCDMSTNHLHESVIDRSRPLALLTIRAKFIQPRQRLEFG